MEQSSSSRSNKNLSAESWSLVSSINALSSRSFLPKVGVWVWQKGLVRRLRSNLGSVVVEIGHPLVELEIFLAELLEPLGHVGFQLRVQFFDLFKVLCMSDGSEGITCDDFGFGALFFLQGGLFFHQAGRKNASKKLDLRCQRLTNFLTFFL